ncbi:hypothetical protein OSB04_030715 [Centaurea solstitialis]|uniref:non-specific serine/threonine protein kinase n=1 Tax=Centaurea solstitialis TaxID=347529 RepID=A0AA38VTL1_9ASTR|nr:hypothetical protein OSB04_030715 [Centaurea solstitialis]
MAKFFNEFQHLKIKLEEIKSATDNFGDDNLIGRDSKLGQGNSEFWKEITMLSRYTHENLVSLLGYCDEGDEKILVYEYASRGSLDRHLRDTAFTWTQRLRICLGAARGLSYLHDPKGTQQRVLHRDIKSSNILLDENWNAKVSDLGLSRIGPANQEHTILVSNMVGTVGYLDPLYLEMGLLTKESDVYSFGVVLFEVLCGRLCFEYINSRVQTLVRMWKKSYKEKKLDEIIFQDMLQQMDPSSLETFSNIAYLCLHKSLEERPMMSHVVKELEIALEHQMTYEQRINYEEMNTAGLQKKLKQLEFRKQTLFSERPKVEMVLPKRNLLLARKAERDMPALPKFGDWDLPAEPKLGKWDIPAVPRFRDWDDYNPSYPVGYTMMFNKAIDERKLAGKPESSTNADPVQEASNSTDDDPPKGCFTMLFNKKKKSCKPE